MYALIDCNNFYASCERVFRPDLNGKAIVVLSNNDGCVIARSNEAKTAGIPMGAPAFKYEEIFKKNNIYVFSANFSLYGDMSHRVMTILNKYTPNMEIYSIDECFLKLNGFEKFNLQDYGLKMRKEVFQCTGIPVSIGIAKTKALAKLANRIAKKYTEHTKSVFIINNDQQEKKALKWLKVEDIWGIGRKHVIRLHAKGVKTALDFIQLPDDWVKKEMSVVGLRLKRDLSGFETLSLEHTACKKSIATTRSFPHNIVTFDDLSERVATFAVSCSEKLRQQNTECSQISVFIKTNKHQENAQQYYGSICIDLPYATNSGMDMVKYAIKALERVFKPDLCYKKAGVVALNISPVENHQHTLFSSKPEKQDALMKSLDFCNAKYGQNTVRLGIQDYKRWNMRQEKLSPNYTTDLKDIITIKV